MTDYVADAEGTTAGAAVATGAGLTWTTKNVPGTSSIVTDNTNCANGSRCYLFTIASGDAAYLQQTPVGGAGSGSAMRFKFSAAAAPGNTQVIARFINTSNAAMSNFNVTSTGFFQISDSTGSSAATKGQTGVVSIPFAVSTHIQVRYRVEKGTTTSDGKHYAEWYVGGVLQETFSATAANTTIIDVGTYRMGRAGAVASAYTYRLDTILFRTATTSHVELAEGGVTGVTMTLGGLLDAGTAKGGATVTGATMTLTGGQPAGTGTGKAVTAGVTATLTGAVGVGTPKGAARVTGATLTATGAVPAGVGAGGGRVAGVTMTGAGTVLPGSPSGASPVTVTGVTMELTGAVLPGALPVGAAVVEGVTIGGVGAVLSGTPAGRAFVTGVTMTSDGDLATPDIPVGSGTVEGVTLTCTGEMTVGDTAGGAIIPGVTITGSWSIPTGAADAFRIRGPFGLPFEVTGPVRLPFAVVGPLED